MQTPTGDLDLDFFPSPAGAFDSLQEFYTDTDSPDLDSVDPELSALLVEPPDPETFDEAVQMGLDEAKHKSARTWRLGWLALKVPTEYGKRTLSVWANRIGISASSANKSRWLAKGFPSRIVRKYPELSVEHFTVVRSLLPKEVDPSDPKYSDIYAQIEAFLLDAVTCEWSVNKLTKAVHPDRDSESSGFSISGEVGGEMVYNDDAECIGGVIGVYIEGEANYTAWIEQLSNKGALGSYMSAFFKEDDRE